MLRVGKKTRNLRLHKSYVYTRLGVFKIIYVSRMQLQINE